MAAAETEEAKEAESSSKAPPRLPAWDPEPAHAQQNNPLSDLRQLPRHGAFHLYVYYPTHPNLRRKAKQGARSKLTSPPTDLGIALSSHNISQEFHVLIILVIVTVTIFFSHSLIVLMELTALRRRSVHFIPNMDSMGVYPGGYAAPATPIRVVLGRDEEALSSERGGEGESGAPKLAPPPPAYGLWRESVVCISFLQPMNKHTSNTHPARRP